MPARTRSQIQAEIATLQDELNATPGVSIKFAFGGRTTELVSENTHMWVSQREGTSYTGGSYVRSSDVPALVEWLNHHFPEAFES
jgi:hypothetical protein